MIKLVRTDSAQKHFCELTAKLENELRIRDGDASVHLAKLNQVNGLNRVLVAYENELPVGCGAIRPYTARKAEIKRMYVEPKSRGRGIATLMLTGLEQWAVELGYRECVLETGKNQPEAIALYEKSGYRAIPNFGKYKGEPNSVCFAKTISL